MKKESNRSQDLIVDRRNPSRATEKRAFESRSMERRPRVFTEKKDHLHVNNIPEGFKYKWIRESVLGEPDTSRIIDATEDGWKPVPSSRHPEKVQEDFFGRTSQVKGYISRKGGILCEREDYLCEEEREQYERLNQQQTRSIPSTSEWTAHPSMPGFMDTNKTTFGFE